MFRRLTLPLALLVTLVVAPAAHADWRQAIRDCATDGSLHQHYSPSDLQQAIRNLPSDVAEYSDCDAVLRAALAGRQVTNRGGINGLLTPSGAVAGSPADLRALAGLHGRPTVRVAGRDVTPQDGGLFKLASRTAQNSLPAPLLVSLLATALLGTIAAFAAIHRRWPDMRRAALRIIRR